MTRSENFVSRAYIHTCIKDEWIIIIIDMVRRC